MLLLCQRWAKQQREPTGDSVTALICDHGLRASSASECEALRKGLERDFGLAARVFAPDMPLSSYKGNLQQNMRLFRLQKMLGWCFENEVSCLALGHTRDDQIETYTMQEAGLLRGRGGMREMRRAQWQGREQERKQGRKKEREEEGREVFLLRPLLEASKISLQTWLQKAWLQEAWFQDKKSAARSVAGSVSGSVMWLEDPSNASPCYARNRIRPVCARLSQVEQARLLARCAMLRKEEQALEKAVQHFTRTHATWHAEGYVRIESEPFLALDEKVALKVLAGVARSVGGKGVRRRQVQRIGRAWRTCLKQFLLLHKACQAESIDNISIDKVSIDKKESATFSLGRCLLFARGGVFFATRAALGIEPLPVTSALLQDRLWDGRLRVSLPLCASACPPSLKGWTCKPLGREGVVFVRRCPNLDSREHEPRYDARLERSLARFEELPWRVREVMPSFWQGGELRALPTLGLVLEKRKNTRLLSLRGAEGLPRVRFVCADEQNLLLPT